MRLARERQILRDPTHIWNLKKAEPIEPEDGSVLARGRGGGGMGGGVEITNFQLIHLNRLVLGCGFQHGDYSYRHRSAYLKVVKRQYVLKCFITRKNL